MDKSILIAFLLSLIAGLSTVIGSLMCIFVKKDNMNFLSFILSFSAGVMIYLSLFELIKEANILLESNFSNISVFITFIVFLIGASLTWLIDKIVINKKEKSKNKKLMKLGIFTAIALAIHNFPEGILTFTSAIKNPALGIFITIAIAIHNIPEGIAVSTPIYFSTGNKKKSIFYSFISGLSEPLGAIIGYIFLLPYLNDTMFGVIFGIVAGIMTYISIFELIPEAISHNKKKSIYGLISGIIFMSIGVMIFG